MKFRAYLLWSFLAFGAVSVLASAIIMNVTVGWSEDETLRMQLETLADPTKDTGFYQGSLDELPAYIRQAVAGVSSSYVEIDHPKDLFEAHVVRTGQGADATYTAIVLDKQVPTLPLVITLLMWTLTCGLIAALGSYYLARRLSSPVEQLVTTLESGVATRELNILELQLLQDRIVETQRTQKERLDREASFNRSVSHELRTPLASLQATIEVMQTRDLEPSTRESVARMSRSVRRIQDTAEVLLQIARDEHYLRSTFKDFQDGLNNHVLQLDHTNACIDVKISDSTERHIGRQWPAALIATSVLLDNAIRYGNNTPILVMVEGQSLSVQDSGPGMAAEVQENLAQGKAKPGHLGFGIIHRICERCGWQIKITSSTQGTTVSLAL